jgi:hypothetical protein
MSSSSVSSASPSGEVEATGFGPVAKFTGEVRQLTSHVYSPPGSSSSGSSSSASSGKAQALFKSSIAATGIWVGESINLPDEYGVRVGLLGCACGVGKYTVLATKETLDKRPLILDGWPGEYGEKEEVPVVEERYRVDAKLHRPLEILLTAEANRLVRQLYNDSIGTTALPLELARELVAGASRRAFVELLVFHAAHLANKPESWGSPTDNDRYPDVEDAFKAMREKIYLARLRRELEQVPIKSADGSISINYPAEMVALLIQSGLFMVDGCSGYDREIILAGGLIITVAATTADGYTRYTTLKSLTNYRSEAAQHPILAHATKIGCFLKHSVAGPTHWIVQLVSVFHESKIAQLGCFGVYRDIWQYACPLILIKSRPWTDRLFQPVFTQILFPGCLELDKLTGNIIDTGLLTAYTLMLRDRFVNPIEWVTAAVKGIIEVNKGKKDYHKLYRSDRTPEKGDEADEAEAVLGLEEEPKASGLICIELYSTSKKAPDVVEKTIHKRVYIDGENSIRACSPTKLGEGLELLNKGGYLDSLIALKLSEPDEAVIQLEVERVEVARIFARWFEEGCSIEDFYEISEYQETDRKVLIAAARFARKMEMDGLQADLLHRLVIDDFKKFRIDRVCRDGVDPAVATIYRLGQLEEIWRQPQGRFAPFFGNLRWIFQDGWAIMKKTNHCQCE